MVRLGTVLFLFLALVFIGRIPAGSEDKEGRLILAKIVAAMGGEANVTKFKAVSFKAKGIMHVENGMATFAEESYFQPPYQYRVEFDIDFPNMQKVKETFIFQKDNAWLVFNNNSGPLPKELRASFHDYFYGLQAAVSPWDFLAKDYKLSPLGEVMVGDRPALGLRILREGRPDVNLYVDKVSYLPVKGEFRAKTVGGNNEVTHEMTFGQHKEFMGVKAFTKMTWKQDGNMFLEREVSEAKPLEKLDDSYFAMP